MIKKIKMPSDEVFFEEYMKKLEPVVITNMFEGQSVRNLQTREDVIQNWGHVSIGIQSEYSAAYVKTAGKQEPGAKEGDSSMTIAEYFEYVRQNPTTKLMCIEFPSPVAFKESFSVPTVCETQPGESKIFVNQCFIGNKGNFAHIHFDKAGTHGFLYQVFGRKKFIVWGADSSHRLATFGQISCWNLENFTPRDRQSFLEFTGGREVTLEPGDCMFVPMMCWHYVDYLDDSMSISLRFRRPHFMTKLANTLFPDFHYMGIAQKIAHQKAAETTYAHVMQKIDSAWNQQYENGVDKVNHIRKLAGEIYKELYNEAPQKSYLIEVEKHLPPMLPAFLDANDPRRPIRE